MDPPKAGHPHTPRGLDIDLKVGELAKLDIERPTSGEVYGPQGRAPTHPRGLDVD